MQKVSKQKNPILTVLAARSEEEWIKKLAKVKEDVRRPVAYLVWWNFLANRSGKNRFLSFDQYLGHDSTQYPPNKLINGLIKVGYTRELAIARIGGKGFGIHAKKS
jgi:hypothetical protein